jgi:triosephosphate isomerase
MRKPIIAGNWKMNCVLAEAEALVQELRSILDLDAALSGVDVLVCPPFTALASVHPLLKGSSIRMGGQNLFWKERGAYTGQVSPAMLLDTGCEYVIVGHSEPRGRFGVPDPEITGDFLSYFGDNDAVVNRKLIAALAAGLKPICCVGEMLSERHSDRTDPVVAGQTRAALHGVTAEQAAGLIFAYEPVWAIGTGEVCEAAEADRVCGVVRSTVGDIYGAAIAEAVRVQYGGSVKPDNAVELLGKPNIDGALVGGTSLKARDFAAIVSAAATDAIPISR